LNSLFEDLMKMMTMIDDTNQALSFWKSRKGIILQIVIVLIPSFLFLRSGNLLLLGILFSVLLAWAGLRLQQLKWFDTGLKRPSNLKNMFLTVIVATILLIFLSYMLRHILTSIIHQDPNLEAFKSVKGNPAALMAGLAVVWVFGAFGEEMLFRGFLINAFYKILPANYFNDRVRWGLSLLVTSILVGFGHSYQGITGIILTGVIGLYFGLIYLKFNHNLWPSILTHGLYDTVAFIMVFSGFNLDQLFK
jgi:membrane protease YdiL (CAAX protease family)